MRNRMPNMFTFEDFEMHSERRRALSRIYSKSHLLHSKNLRAQNEHVIFRRLKPILDSHASSGEPLEVFETMLSVAMDIVTAFLFGLENSSNFLQNIEQRKLRLSQYQSRLPYVFFTQEVQSIWTVLEKLGVSFVPKAVQKNTESFDYWILEMCRGSQKELVAKPDGLAEGVGEKTVHQNLSKAVKVSKEGTTRKEELAIASEMVDHTSMFFISTLLEVADIRSRWPRDFRHRDDISPL